MKHILFILFIVLFIACTNRELVQQPACGEIVFTSSVVETLQRGTPIREVELLPTMAVFGYYTGDGSENSWENVGSETTPNIFSNTSLVNVGGAWQSVEPAYWPDPSDANVSFIAYSPSASTENGVEVAVDKGAPILKYTVPLTCSDQPDLMVSVLAKDKNRLTTSVPLSFKHALTAVGFAAKGVCESIEWITVRGVETSGELQTGEANIVWRNLSGDKSVTYSAKLEDVDLSDSLQTVVANDGYLMMIPQTLPSEATLTVKRAGKAAIDLSIGGDVWSAGEQFVYNLEIENDTAYLMLVDFESDAYIAKTAGKTLWNIMDVEAEARDFISLLDVLREREKQGEERLTITFPKIESLPNSALYSGLSSEKDTALKSLYLPEATQVGRNSCTACGNLELFSAPKATMVASGALRECEQLTQVNLPLVDSLYNAAFQECTSLKNIELPNCSFVDQNVFYKCSDLLTADLPEATYLGPSAFRECVDLKTVYLPELETLSFQSFYKCSSLQSIDLPVCDSIAGSCFLSCTSLEQVSAPEITKIRENAFLYCESLERVYTPNVDSVYYRSFSQCISLQQIELPVCKLVSNLCFHGCSELKKVDMPEATLIDAQAFGNCSDLVDVSIKKATIIEDRAFEYCSSLGTVSFPLVTSVGWTSFYNCTSLESIYLPIVETLESRAFEKCSKLKEVDFPLAESVGQSCFSSCSLLQQVDLPLVACASEAMFYKCTSLSCVNLPNVTQLEDYLFKSCTQLSNVTVGVNGAFTLLGELLFDSGSTCNATLNLGCVNSSYVSGNSFVGITTVKSTSFSYDFNTIKYVTP